MRHTDDFGQQDPPRIPTPTASSRVIGAAGGGFVLCFVAILCSLPFLDKVDALEVGTIIWIGAMVLGAVGGAIFPQVGHFAAYAFVLFLNAVLSLTIGRNAGEQIKLFGIFAFLEVVFFMTRTVMRNTQS